MTLIELQSQLRSAGLLPILVDNEPPEEHRNRLMFAGTFPDYVEAVKALQVRAVFVYSEMLEESDFQTEVDGDGEAPEATIDLRTSNKDLARFSERVGQAGLLWLSISMGDEHLDLALEAPWWIEFLEMRDEAIEQISLEDERRQSAERSSRRAETAELMEGLHALAEDAKFTKLPTQKAMLQYALRAIPKLKSLEQDQLKMEIQELKARIDAGVS
jgi:hypothetical protein